MDASEVLLMRPTLQNVGQFFSMEPLEDRLCLSSPVRHSTAHHASRHTHSSTATVVRAAHHHHHSSVVVTIGTSTIGIQQSTAPATLFLPVGGGLLPVTIVNIDLGMLNGGIATGTTIPVLSPVGSVIPTGVFTTPVAIIDTGVGTINIHGSGQIVILNSTNPAFTTFPSGSGFFATLPLMPGDLGASLSIFPTGFGSTLATMTSVTITPIRLFTVA
jgi:hypothetical protein